MADTQRAFATLDLLRGVGALAVVVTHYPDFFGLERTNGAYLAVDLFYVLSGFVLAYAYERRIAAGMPPVDFVIARFVRLYPLYLLGTVIALAVYVLLLFTSSPRLTGPEILLTLPFSLLFLPTFVAPFLASYGGLGAVYPLNFPAWTLFYELAVNLLYGFSYRLLTTRRLIVMVFVSAIALIFTGLYFGNLAVGYAWIDFIGGVPRVLFSFFAGVLLWRLFQSYRPSPLPGYTAIALILVFVCTAAGDTPTAAMRPYYELFAVLIVFPCMVFIAARTVMGRRLRAISLQLGLASYAVYIIHTPVLHGLKKLFPPVHPYITAAAPWSGLAIAALLIGAGILLERYFHQPIRDAVLGAMKSRKRARALQLAAGEAKAAQFSAPASEALALPLTGGRLGYEREETARRSAAN
jgi:peptidoglycan/LPS O-acetylase OafA/YrhL